MSKMLNKIKNTRASNIKNQNYANAGLGCAKMASPRLNSPIPNLPTIAFFNQIEKSETEVLMIKELLPLMCDFIKLNYSIFVDRDSSKDEDDRCVKDSPCEHISENSILLIKLSNGRTSYNVYLDKGSLVIVFSVNYHTNELVSKLQIGNPKFEFSNIPSEIKKHIVKIHSQYATEINKKLEFINQQIGDQSEE